VSTATFNLDVQARDRPVAVAASVEFDAARDPHVWIHGRFKHGGLYFIWWAVCRAGRALGYPVPAPWDLKGASLSRHQVRLRMSTADDFLLPAPLDFSLGDDPQESPYFSRPLLDAFKGLDAQHAELFAVVESDLPPDAAQRCQVFIDKLDHVARVVDVLAAQFEELKGGRLSVDDDLHHHGASDAPGT
jgi:hypothetical protein